MPDVNPYEGLQELVARVPELVQPFIVALAGAIPYIEGEGSAGHELVAQQVVRGGHGPRRPRRGPAGEPRRGPARGGRRGGAVRIS